MHLILYIDTFVFQTVNFHFRVIINDRSSSGNDQVENLCILLVPLCAFMLLLKECLRISMAVIKP